MEVTKICLVCNFETETVVHCLTSCGLARDCWQWLEVSVILPGERGRFIVWLEKILSVALGVEVEELIVVLWHLWFNGNKILWSNENESIAGIIGATYSCLKTWRDAQVQNENRARGRRLHSEDK
ncbi:hypothetical protein AAHA92_14244 [Salvia divinorum]|uniref:Reverse transcriptase zinc-binding domain-containing protein n=1 Tax=Salvia divinorum TaxID=28513 RepID=A0ABD1HAY2_SALDI